MTALCLEPHADDCALFCAFEAQRLHAYVVTVLASKVQHDRGTGVSQQMREAESQCAMRELGLEWTQWPYPDDSPDWDAVEAAMRAIDDRLRPETVLAPAFDFATNGHREDDPPANGWGVMQHDQVGRLAAKVFDGRIVRYHAYTRWGGRTREGTPVVGTPGQIMAKLRALACYRSQIAEPSCQPWFLDGMTEWLA